MTNILIQPLWLTHFIEILLVLEFQLTKFIIGAFSYKAHFKPQISSNGPVSLIPIIGILITFNNTERSGESILINFNN